MSPGIKQEFIIVLGSSHSRSHNGNPICCTPCRCTAITTAVIQKIIHQYNRSVRSPTRGGTGGGEEKSFFAEIVGEYSLLLKEEYEETCWYRFFAGEIKLVERFNCSDALQSCRPFRAYGYTATEDIKVPKTSPPPSLTLPHFVQARITSDTICKATQKTNCHAYKPVRRFLG